MNKKFHIVSLGPGDPELLTIKALKCLLESDIIIIPTQGKQDKCSRSFQIIKKAEEQFNEIIGKSKDESSLPEFYHILSPMRYDESIWQRQVQEIHQLFELNNTLSYVTIGDVGVYSTAYYLLEIIKEKHPIIYDNTHVVPGITSYSDASAKVKKPLCLGPSKLEICHWEDNPKTTTKVYMRPKSGDTLNHLQENGDMHFFEYLGYENEKISKGLPEEKPSYLSLLIDFAQ